jgi:hypothetical protein
MFNFFKRKKKTEASTTVVPKPKKVKNVHPIPGDVYRLDRGDTDNPFEKDPCDVTVKAVQAGYVNYAHGYMFNNESMDTRSFLNCYKLYEPSVDITVDIVGNMAKMELLEYVLENHATEENGVYFYEDLHHEITKIMDGTSTKIKHIHIP